MTDEEKRVAALQAALRFKQIEAIRTGHATGPRIAFDFEQLKSLATKFLKYIESGELKNE